MDSYLEKLIAATPSWAVTKLKPLSQSDEELTIILEDFCERAGIMEYEGNMTRFIAEKKALECILNTHIDSVSIVMRE